MKTVAWSICVSIITHDSIWTAFTYNTHSAYMLHYMALEMVMNFPQTVT